MCQMIITYQILEPDYFDLNNRTLERELETEYYGRHWWAYGRALDYQNLQPFNASIQRESYNVMPQLFFKRRISR